MPLEIRALFNSECTISARNTLRIGTGRRRRDVTMSSADLCRCSDEHLLPTRPDVQRSIVMSVSVCVRVSVCFSVHLSTIISSELHVRSSPEFSRILSMAVAPCYSGRVMTRYVLPVLWMTSYLLTSQDCSTSLPS